MIRVKEFDDSFTKSLCLVRLRSFKLNMRKKHAQEWDKICNEKKMYINQL